MPLYEYECSACQTRFELIRKFSDPPVEVCPTCGSGPVQKLVSSPAFQFKGSGWYVTDYARKAGGEKAGGEAPAAEAGAAKTETASSKTDAATDSKDSKDTKDTKPATKPAASTSSKDS
jgi:putative FmdB family regulatory protein